MSNGFFLQFLNASVFAGLFVSLFVFGLYVIARATKLSSLPTYNWERETLAGRSPIRLASQQLEPRRAMPRERGAQLDL